MLNFKTIIFQLDSFFFLERFILLYAVFINNMEEELLQIIVDMFMLAQMLMIYERFKTSKRIHAHWVHPINQTKERGAHANLLPQLREDDDKFQNYMRMSPGLFDLLLETIRADIEKCDTHWREALVPELKLMVALR